MSISPSALALLVQAARGGGVAPTPPMLPPAGGSQPNANLFPSLFPQAAQAPEASINPGPGTVLPPSSPFPSTPSGVDPQMLNRASQMGMEETGTQLQRARSAGDLAGEAIQRQASIPLPKTGWLDTQGQPPAPGAGHAILRALLSIAAATRPGQAIQQAQYGPGLRRYGMETGALAQQIADLQKRQQLEEQPLPSTTGMVYHPWQAEIGQERADAMRDRVKAYTEYTQKIPQLKQELINIAQGNLTEKQRHDRVSEFLTGQGIEVQRDRNGVILTIGMGGQQLKADEFNAAVANKNQGLIQQILQGLGAKAFQGVPSPTGTTETQQITAGAPNPMQTPPSTAPPSKTPPPKGRRRVIDLTK